MNSTAPTSLLPFPGSAEAPEILCVTDIVRPDVTEPNGEPLVRDDRHRSQGTRLPRPRRHEAPRRLQADDVARPAAAPSPSIEEGLPVGTRVCFERRPAQATAAEVDRAEFAQAAASYVFAAALLACTFFI